MEIIQFQTFVNTIKSLAAQVKKTLTDEFICVSAEQQLFLL